ncbi:hypothetical protein FLONG3_8104 [Fusarium longipes]|uniref:Uncharacterized protein n=1 Tax=Fusarium longipes TaxID=694270 RepID=A0A395S8K5_9HYPO|nr:hypothetical protein FLONG3_8104 [Fusarium longipes]
MAHQAERLPWHTLASIFELRPTNPCQHDALNLHQRDGPEAVQAIYQFMDAFLKNATSDAQRKREKYPEKHDPLDPGIFLRSMTGAECEDEGVGMQYERSPKDEIILTDELVEKITPTVRRWLPKNKGGSAQNMLLCPHTDNTDKCGCALPYKERQLAAFQRDCYPNGCYEFDRYNREAYRNLEFVKTLLLLGEMDPILRCVGLNLGWNMICDYAITMYLTLNIIYCFPETWKTDDGSPVDDYRNLGSYQKAIRLCTMSNGCQVATYPHRDVFGIEDGQFHPSSQPYDISRWRHIAKEDTFLTEMMGMGDPEEPIETIFKLEFYPYGLMTYEEFLSLEKPTSYRPHPTDVLQIRWMLGKKGLPIEISDSILSAADYVPKRSLPIDGKPFHPGNKAELGRYLDECWQLIVRTLAFFGINISVFLERFPWIGRIIKFITDFAMAP